MAERSGSVSTGPIRTPGGTVELLADADRPGGWMLLIDRVRQSYVDLDDPTYLDFEYMESFASVVDHLPPGPLRVTHIGGGALSFPRFLSAVRPGSSQIVLEPNATLTGIVRERLPLPKHSGIRVRDIDGVAGLAALADGSADLIVLDAFDGARVPSAFGSADFVGAVARVLAPDGVFLANVADGPEGRYVRRFLATLAGPLPHRLVIADPAVVKGRRFGNVILAAGRTALPVAEITRASARRMFPQSVLAGGELQRWLGTATPFEAGEGVRSPEPPEYSWKVQLDDDFS